MNPKIKEMCATEAEPPVLDGAFEEFVKSGYAATRLEDLAARACVTKGTIYFYFETKERVFDEMIRHKFPKLFPELGSYAEELEGSYSSRLHALIVFV